MSSPSMTTANEPADPIAKGIIPTAKQSFLDLFKWKQRVVVTNDFGEEHTEWQSPEPLKNPISLMAQLSARDWLFFVCGFLAWTADAFDFHALSIQTVKFAKYYKQSNTNITTAITLTLLLRSVGAAFFGLAGDKFGRKWPMVINMIVLGLLQIATIYSTTFQQFLAVRSLFGLFMGGVYGNAIAMALEHCPVNARGLMSGILQQGYAFGYVLAACANLGVGGAVESWKTVFWAAAGISIGIGLIRICFPESKQFLEAKKNGHKNITAGAFFKETKVMLAKEWKMCIYCVILMTWFNFYSHTSQDSYTTFMREAKGLNNAAASRASIWMKVGACVGGCVIGYTSQFVGRRRAIIGSAFMSALMIPAWILPSGEHALSATGFLIQFFVQGAWGVIPIHLNELSPVAFRSSFPGITYQLGNMISSPSAQIVNALAENISVKDEGGPSVPAYGPVMAVATAIIAVGIILTTSVGPEKRGRKFEEAAPAGATAAIPTKDIETGDDLSDEKHSAREIEGKV
ncbi:MFS general substrate transporter [Glarea lozoyensis ATCC 20868]|uniref:MFS general substrate transporter n=1 Tax=Glarea lozoyensis (strain ATCC 20868 / MF5171) TaxID=1116229 RepID=S3DA70_GLAL2|nr:MFS general substrate transporter [Glarea lozoyensis ATCC 20868]EPE28861.1 MFS general substrate transporter [Glarea lozoyensis ATCC 20868]